jgi:hypothetical protein
MDKTIADYLSFGLSVVPVGPDKRPLVAWKQYQDRLPTLEEAERWTVPVAIVAGQVSGGLICIDFDDRGSQFKRWGEMVVCHIPDIRQRMLVQRTPSGGYHVVFRCHELECRNQKLASRPPRPGELDKDGSTPVKVVCMIETRAEGGYFVAAPSPGYSLIWGGYDKIPTYTADEAHVLLSCAGELDQMPDEIQPEPTAPRSGAAHGGMSPFDDFDSKNDPIAMLEGIGWHVVRKAGDKYMLRRPGKKDGISATWNHKPGRLYVFSTSCEFLRDNHYYKPSAVYAAINHGNDFSAAAKDLYRQGYGSRLEQKQAPDIDNDITTRSVKISQFKKRIYDFYKQPRFSGLSLGITGLDNLIRFDHKYLNVITGIPTHGKSEFLDFITIELVKKYGWNFAVFSPENYPLEIHFNKLAEKYMGCSLWGKEEHYIAEAIDELDKHFDFVDATEEELTLDTILSEVLRLKATKQIDALIIDPWNEIEYTRPKDQSETEYIGNCLRRLRKFARKNNVCVFLVAHPAKMYRDKHNETYPVPTLYDISSSANFYNKCDNGLVVYRNFDNNTVDVFVKKVKYKNYGQIGVVTFRWIAETGSYEETKEGAAWSSEVAQR